MAHLHSMDRLTAARTASRRPAPRLVPPVLAKTSRWPQRPNDPETSSSRPPSTSVSNSALPCAEMGWMGGALHTSTLPCTFQELASRLLSCRVASTTTDIWPTTNSRGRTTFKHIYTLPDCLCSAPLALSFRRFLSSCLTASRAFCPTSYMTSVLSDHDYTANYCPDFSAIPCACESVAADSFRCAGPSDTGCLCSEPTRDAFLSNFAECGAECLL